MVLSSIDQYNYPIWLSMTFVEPHYLRNWVRETLSGHTALPLIPIPLDNAKHSIGNG